MINDTCQAAIPSGKHLKEWQECGQKAVATYSYVCVHEHIVTRATCIEHEPFGDAVGCRQCWDAGHDCPMAYEMVS